MCVQLLRRIQNQCECRAREEGKKRTKYAASSRSIPVMSRRLPIVARKRPRKKNKKLLHLDLRTFFDLAIGIFEMEEGRLQAHIHNFTLIQIPKL